MLLHASCLMVPEDIHQVVRGILGDLTRALLVKHAWGSRCGRGNHVLIDLGLGRSRDAGDARLEQVMLRMVREKDCAWQLESCR